MYPTVEDVVAAQVVLNLGNDIITDSLPLCVF